jgi:phosphate transport system substrate-binding protein
MISFQRLFGALVLMTLLLTPAFASAQDALTVAGSGVAAPLFDALVTASGAAPTLTTTINGTRAGMEQLCANSAQIALTNRAINTDEETACTTNGVQFLELLLGDYAVSLISNPADGVAQCLTTPNLNLALAPSAQGQITNWRAVDIGNPDLTLTVIVPPSDSAAYALIDGLVEGDGLRADATAQADDAAIIDAVASSPGALGVVSYNAAVAAGDRVRALNLASASGTCVSPNAATIANGQYPASQRLYAYVNSTASTNTTLAPVLAFLGTDAITTPATDAGFVAPDAEALALNSSIVTNLTIGRQHSVVRSEFVIPPSVVGSISVAGDAAGFDYVQDLSTSFLQTYQGVQIDVSFGGRVEGTRRLCNGEVDMIALTSPLTDEQNTNCAANNIVPVTVPVGKQAAVLIANAGNDYLQCLTSAQIGTIWNATSGGTVTAWNQVDPAYPATTMTLLAPTLSNDVNDLLLNSVVGVSAPLRVDAVVAGDPLYRAASVAVVDGALTYMDWNDYQRVVENEQANIQAVAVDSGSGCIAPSEATIADGSYPLVRDLSLVISQTALRRAEVQSFVWYLFTDENQTRFDLNNLIGATLADLPSIRETLQAAYDAAGAAALTPTPAPTVESTPAADATPATDATAAPTEAATATP